jgi:hypothetical protein
MRMNGKFRTPAALTQREKSFWLHEDRRLGGPRIRPGPGNEEKNFYFHAQSNPNSPVVQPIA